MQFYSHLNVSGEDVTQFGFQWRAVVSPGLPQRVHEKRYIAETMLGHGAFTVFHMLRAVLSQTIEGIFLAGLFPWHFYIIGQYTLERFRADGERIRRDKGHAPGANPPRGLQARKKRLHVIFVSAKRSTPDLFSVYRTYLCIHTASSFHEAQKLLTSSDWCLLDLICLHLFVLFLFF